MAESILEAIYDLEPEGRLMNLLSQTDRSSIEALDSQGLNTLHHCIIAGHVGAAKLVWQRGFFLHHQPDIKLPYVHLACLLGRAQFIPALTEHLPSSELDIRVQGTDWINLDTLIGWVRRAEPYSNLCDKLEKACRCFPEDDELLSALDTAAIAQHLNCVIALLAINSQSDVLDRAVDLRSHRALGFLLKAQTHGQDHLDTAFKSALRKKRPQCLKLLVEQGVRAEKILNRLNPYHVLYMYSSAYQDRGSVLRNQGLDECTAVLIQHGFSVNVQQPIGSYPLYSIIHAIITEKDQFPNKIPVFHINCLEHLLNAGADPNFDENAFFNDRSLNDRLFAATLGRDLFSSGLNALFSMLQSSDTYRPHQAEHLDRCCLSILEHGADPNYLDGCGERPLHSAVKALAMQHAMGHVRVDYGSMVRMLLYHGADPNLKSSTGLHAAHYYFVILLNLMGGLIAFTRWKNADNASQVLQLLYYMNMSDAVSASKRLIATLENAGDRGDNGSIAAKENGNHGDMSSVETGGGDVRGEDSEEEAFHERSQPVPDSVLLYVQDLIAEYVYKPKSLQENCRMVIWRAVGHQRHRLRHLHLPRALCLAILDMFMLDLDF